jgi:uncharacterized membrane protein
MVASEVAAMDQFFFHPKVVHLPMALAVLMPLVTGGALFACWRGWFDRRVWIIVLLLQAALVGSGFIAMNTGEAEEERVEEIVAEQYIESHEEAAEAFVWASVVVLALMLLPMVLPERRVRTVAALGACLGTLLVFGLGFKAGEAGGRLVYEHGAAQAYVAPGVALPGDGVDPMNESADSDSDD